MIQRILSGLVLILMGAVGAVLLRPDLFPDVSLPSALADAPTQRTMLGLIVSGATGLILLGLATGGLRGARASRRDTSLGAGPRFETEEEPVAPASLTTVASERNWAPLPPLRVVEAETQPETTSETPPETFEAAVPAAVADATPESAPQDAPEPMALLDEPLEHAEPVAPLALASVDDAGPQDATASADEGAQPPLDQAPETGSLTTSEAAEVEHEAAQPEEEAAGLPEAVDDAGAAPSTDHAARLAELTAAADLAKAEGRDEEATDLYEEALTEARALHASNPTDLSAQAALAESLGRVALMSENDNRLDLALQQHEEGLALYRSIAANAPEEPKWAQGLVGALGRLADCREVRGHRSRARDLYAEAVAITQRLTWLQPESQSYAQAFAQSKARFAELDAELQGEPV